MSKRQLLKDVQRAAGGAGYIFRRGATPPSAQTVACIPGMLWTAARIRNVSDLDEEQHGRALQGMMC
ncbi:hypothetical protein SLH47_20240 [Cognatiyoonia sp. IB215182]|nr:hypothetical protein [Cognatiyoonia sp. IB215182]